MGRERQKKKNKSSIPKVRPKKRPRQVNPKSNPLIAANWDSKLTLAQNYRRLGLTAKLNAPTGGTEKAISEIPDSVNLLPKQPHDSLAIVSKQPKYVVPEDVQVERDPETGAIVRVTDPNWRRSSNPLNDPLNDILDEQPRNDDGRPGKERNPLVEQLELQAATEIRKKPRHQSQRESEWIEKLVQKYGDDYARMAKDGKLNPYQQSLGDIRRRVTTWKQRNL